MTQVYVLAEPDTREDKGRLLTATQVAEIWNERAAVMGFPNTHYTRFSVRQRRGKGLEPADETPWGYRYWESDARAIILHPRKSQRRTTKAA